jgi:hypothetical protein
MSTSSIGGYSVTEVRTAGGDETWRFEARLLLDGQVIAVVSNGGEGGCHSYRPTDPSPRAARAAFERFATACRGPDGGFEDGDALIYRLLERWFDAQPIEVEPGCR